MHGPDAGAYCQLVQRLSKAGLADTGRAGLEVPGEDAVIAKECEIAYNATLMALLWDAVATRSARLLEQGIRSLPGKLDRATWLNYVRCHDDIGLAFDDADVARAGFDPSSHRAFLLDYFTGEFEGSSARGAPFARNEKSGDARISGSLASLAGALVDMPCLQVKLEGFADTRGSRRYNRKLSMRRVYAVWTALARSGLPVERMLSAELASSGGVAGAAK